MFILNIMFIMIMIMIDVFEYDNGTSLYSLVKHYVYLKCSDDHDHDYDWCLWLCWLVLFDIKILLCWWLWIIICITGKGYESFPDRICKVAQKSCKLLKLFPEALNCPIGADIIIKWSLWSSWLSRWWLSFSQGR